MGPSRGPLLGPSWTAAEALGDPGWVVELREPERAELVRAARSAAGQGLTAAGVTRESFPLPTASALVGRVVQDLAVGRGFVLLRGFPIDELTEEEAALAFLGLGTHLGAPVGQNKAGDLLTHIRDERLADPNGARRYRTNLRQEFHTDGADIIGLLCLHEARQGGESRIASTAAICAELAARRPDLFEVLHRPFPWDRQGEELPGEPGWFELAPFAEVAGATRVFYIGWYIRDSQRHPDAPRLTAEQEEAMALLEAIADDPRFRLEMAFRPGDVQLLNNARILHAREAYVDEPDPAQRRHLLRLWLAAHDFASVEDLLRGGLGTPLEGRGEPAG